MPGLPPPPAPSPLMKKRMASASKSSTMSSSSSNGLLPPPPHVTNNHNIVNNGSSSPQRPAGHTPSTGYSQSLAKSMTIDEMRALHKRALGDAEAKQTELRLVLASRYRELVGSSDEVTKMRERAGELDGLVSALPGLMESLLAEASPGAEGFEREHSKAGKESPREESGADGPRGAALRLRGSLSKLPREVHRALDRGDVYGATASLVELFREIAGHTDEYPLATALAPQATPRAKGVSPLLEGDVLLRAQARMTVLHVQTLPVKISRISRSVLDAPASFARDNGSEAVSASSAEAVEPKHGAQRSAAALAALDMLSIEPSSTTTTTTMASPPKPRDAELLDAYYEAKAGLLRSLLDQLRNSGTNGEGTDRAPRANNGTSSDNNNNNSSSSSGNTTSNAEDILSKIVLILQYDIVLHPYQIFVLRKFPTTGGGDKTEMMKSLPIFPAAAVRAKTSGFLSAHLPLIRTKVKSVLVEIAGTTASALGKIRQSLYDKTDGIECTERLNDTDGICTWDEAVGGVVDVPTVLLGIGGSGSSSAEPASASPGTSAPAGTDRKFSLWGVLFSNTFSSLVHSLLTSSFQSVHTKLVSTLRLSLTNAPPLRGILPHEAYRNTLHIASQLDTALLKVSEDAHELLVHAEERVESERRLRQSLYVQTCEIMGRLICELRRMLLDTNHNSNGSSNHSPASEGYDAVKQLIVGRLCHLLKFRLTALSTLLDPNSSPAVLHQQSGGMISIAELSSAFELADDKDSGLITFREAMEAVDSAFSGTHFHGAEMVRETLLLPAAGRDQRGTPNPADSGSVVTPGDVTLDELTLLLARGLRHEASGGHSALGAIQNSLDRMVESSFRNWAREVLRPSSASLSEQTKRFVVAACSSPEEEFRRLYASSEAAASPQGAVVTNVSPHVSGYLMDISFVLSRSVCPSDSLLPVPSRDYAVAMGVDGASIPRMIDTIRCALLREGFEASTSVLTRHLGPALDGTSAPLLSESGPSGIAQTKNDLSFLQACFFERNQYGFGSGASVEDSKGELASIVRKTDHLFRRSCNRTTVQVIGEKRKHLLEAGDLFFSSLFGKDKISSEAAPVGGFGFDASSQAGVGVGNTKTPLFHPPLESSCRFPLLPIQADRTLSGVQARGKYKEKEENENHSQKLGSGTVRAGFGFFSSMLKTGS